MRVSKEQAAANRARILDVASHAFREHGFGGIGVADLMKQAGLTHGGFYGHFESKEDLMAQACERAHAPKLARWRRLAETEPQKALARIVADYLRPEHRDAPSRGCLLAALAAEAPRHGPRVRQAVSDAAEAQVEILAGLMPARTRAQRRDRALALYAALVGALILSRAVSDPKLSDGFLKATAGHLGRLTA